MTATPTWTSADVERRLRGLVDRLRSSADAHGAADRAMGEAVAGFLDRIEGRGSRRALDGIVALPFLVRGVHTGDPGPAAPAAMAHVLWWVSARYLDDLSDAPAPAAATVPSASSAASSASAEASSDADRDLLAVVGIACHLSAEILDEACRDDPARALRLRQELSRCWHSAISGQLTDLTATPTTATAEEILAGYRGKTGAPYAMAAAMGAILADCDAERVDMWREFGERFGILRQLANDQRDIASGRNEDLRNGTATYMMVRYLGSLPDGERGVAEKLLAECADSAEAREEFAARLTEPGWLRMFAGFVRPLIDGLHASIEAVGGVAGGVASGAAEYVAGLHSLVDETVNLYPEFLLGSRDRLV